MKTTPLEYYLYYHNFEPEKFLLLYGHPDRNDLPHCIADYYGLTMAEFIEELQFIKDLL